MSKRRVTHVAERRTGAGRRTVVARHRRVDMQALAIPSVMPMERSGTNTACLRDGSVDFGQRRALLAVVGHGFLDLAVMFWWGYVRCVGYIAGYRSTVNALGWNVSPHLKCMLESAFSHTFEPKLRLYSNHILAVLSNSRISILFFQTIF